MKKMFKIMLLYFFGWIFQAQAAIVPDLYQGVVPVHSEDENWSKQVKSAFEQVLVKLTGNASVKKTPEFQKSADQAKDYISRYSYTPRHDAAGTRLKVQFSKKPIDQLITELKLPVWQSDRPVTMAWIVLKQPDQVTLLNSEHPMAQKIEDYGHQRGIPIVLPLLDLSEMSEVNWQDVFSDDLTKLRQLSQRYDADYLLSGELKQDSDEQWQADWQLCSSFECHKFESASQGSELTIQDMVNQLADSLSSQAALSLSGHKNQLTLDIVQVSNFEHLQKVREQLEQLPSVNEVELASVSPNKLEFHLTLQASSKAFIKQLSQTHLFVPIQLGHHNQAWAYRMDPPMVVDGGEVESWPLSSR